MFLIAFAALTVVYYLVKGFRKKLKLLALADGILGGVLGFLIAWVALLAVGSLFKFFFAEKDFYANSVIMKFFGDSSLLNGLKLLDLNEWLHKIQEIGTGGSGQ